jgi:hydroxyacylglutathione hydrolase
VAVCLLDPRSLLMLFRQIGDQGLSQYAYLIGCQRTGEALLIDPERDIDRYDAVAASEGLRITTVTETHIHADFLSGAREYAERPDVRIVLSDAGTPDWKYGWIGSGRATYQLVTGGDRFSVGNIDVLVVHTPGHTPEHVVFVVTDRGGGASEPMGMASGDFLFVGDVGRPDLLESAAGHAGVMRPSAEQLHASLATLHSLPEFLQIWPAHGAGSACGKALGAVPVSTLGYERRYNGALALADGPRAVFVDAILSGQPEPPLYFARMKVLNRDGVPLLGALPVPPAMDIADTAALRDAVVLDTRPDRAAFARGHLRGSLYAPEGRSFSSAAGSCLDPDRDVVLVAAPASVDEIVRALIRIGFDRIVGYVPAEALDAADGLATLDTMSFEEAVRASQADASSVVLDVRGATEFAAGHVAGAINIAHTRLASRVSELPRDASITVHCATGVRAATAAACLQREGFRVRYVNDDFARWRNTAPDERASSALA